MTDTITLPREVAELIENLMHHAYNDGVKQLKYRSSQTVEAEEALRTALAAPKPEPVAAQHRFRLALPAAHWALKIGSPDWGPWHACKVSNRPSWEIDLQGWEVEYRPLYAAPPENEALRRDAKRYEWLKAKVEDYDGHACFPDVPYPAPIPDQSPFDAVDAAIDAAMEDKR